MDRIESSYRPTQIVRKVQRQFNEEGIIFSASNAGTTGDTLAKKQINSTSQSIQKLTQSRS